MHKYRKAVVKLIHSSPVEVIEIASHMPKMNHHISPNICVQTLGEIEDCNKLDIEDSLSHKLINVLHHNSVSEHSMISFTILGMSRGVLQEYVRSRIGIAYTVTSTRYAISMLLYHFMVAYRQHKSAHLSKKYFTQCCINLGIFVMDEEFNSNQLYDALVNLYHKDTTLFTNACYSKGAIKVLEETNENTPCDVTMAKLMDCKTKRVAGDYVKHLVTDSWATNMSVTFNLRSFMTFMKLRDSGAAWYQISDLAKAMKEVTPLDYLKLAKMA